MKGLGEEAYQLTCHIKLTPDVWMESWQVSKACNGKVDRKSSSMCTDHSDMSRRVSKEKIGFCG